MPSTGQKLFEFSGSVHEHSGFSDGEVGTSPLTYFQAARAAGLDFMTSSEHSDGQFVPLSLNGDCASERLAECVLVPSADNPGGGVTKWDFTQEIAETASDELFTAIRGFEWTSDRFGHANVFFSQNELNAKTSDGYAGSMEGLWAWFSLNPALGGGSDGLLVFNHPGREDAIQSNIPDPAYTFNDFELREDAAPRVVGVELFGKGGDAYDIEEGAPAEGWYARALDRGWKVAPTGSEDEHGTVWATPERAKTVMLATENSRDGLREAMLARRFYALAQHHNDLRLSFSADGFTMGSSYSPPDGTIVKVSAAVTDSFPQGGSLELVSNNGAILRAVNTASFVEPLSVDTTERWYYLRVLNSEGRPVAYSAPVWLKAGSDEPFCN